MTPSIPRDNRLLWFLFAALGFMWGSSYLFIKIGVDAGLPPFTLITGRLLFGLLVIGTVVRLAREPLPRDASTYRHLLVMAVINIAIPFSLITWGEQTIDSAIASILNSTVPLFVIVLAPLVLPDESITVNRLAGLAVGFVGVLVLFVPDLAVLQGDSLLGWTALILSAVSYAAGNVYAKRYVHGLRPMIPALFQVAFAFVIALVLALIVDRPIGRVHFSPEAVLAIVWLGIFGSGLAYLAYFRVLRDWGATRTSLVAYLLPVFGIVLGFLFKGEAITPNRVVGTGLIIAGVALVNSRFGTRELYSRGGSTIDARARAAR